MEVTAQQRHQLFVWFEEQMGQERAATMMELIPPAGSSELATKLDLDAKLAEFRAELLRTLGTWLFASQAAVITAVGVFSALD
jgi:hypothetical protein